MFDVLFGPQLSVTPTSRFIQLFGRQMSFHRKECILSVSTVGVIHLFLLNLTTLSVSHTILCRMTELLMNNKLQRMWKDAVLAWFKVLSQHWRGVVAKNNEKSVWILALFTCCFFLCNHCFLLFPYLFFPSCRRVFISSFLLVIRIASRLVSWVWN
jgi:hypothetical protein